MKKFLISALLLAATSSYSQPTVKSVDKGTCYVGPVGNVVMKVVSRSDDLTVYVVRLLNKSTGETTPDLPILALTLNDTLGKEGVKKVECPQGF